MSVLRARCRRSRTSNDRSSAGVVSASRPLLHRSMTVMGRLDVGSASRRFKTHTIYPPIKTGDRSPMIPPHVLQALPLSSPGVSERKLGRRLYVHNSFLVSANLENVALLLLYLLLLICVLRLSSILNEAF